MDDVRGDFLGPSQEIVLVEQLRTKIKRKRQAITRNHHNQNPKFSSSKLARKESEYFGNQMSSFFHKKMSRNYMYLNRT